MKDHLEKIIQDTRKVYKHIADVRIEGNVLVNRNNITGCLHPFSDGRERIVLGKSQMVGIKDILSKFA